MADIKWIKITTDIFDDEKILLIESLPEADSIIVIWFKLLCLAGKMNNSGVFMINDKIPYTDNMLATIFRRKETTIKLALETFENFGMIEWIDNVITIPNWGKYQNIDQLENKRDYMRGYMRNYREKQKQKIDCKTNSKTNSKTNVSAIDKEIDKEIDKDIYNNICAFDNAHCTNDKPTKTQINALFESVWKLYPVKKGKGQVSDAKKAKLYSVGYDELCRAIERYKAELEKDSDWRKPQNGSTFFNSGYVDYLDANYQPQERKPKHKNQFNEFPQREVKKGEMDDLEKQLLRRES